MKLVSILLCTLLAAGCDNSRRGEANTAAAPGVNMVRDLETLPQDCNAYLDANAPPWLETFKMQEERAVFYINMFFGPWHDPPAWSLDRIKQEYLQEICRDGFGENGQKFELSRESLPGSPAVPVVSLDGNSVVRAITIRNTNLRLLPTNRPRFKAPIGDVANGYPFDTLQESAVWAQTPVQPVAKLYGNLWYWVQGPYASGWVPAADLAFVAKPLADQVETMGFVAAIADRHSLNADPLSLNRGEAFGCRSQVYIGNLFPYANVSFFDLKVLLPDANGVAHAMSANAYTAKALDSDEYLTCRFPLPLTPRNLAAVANQMLGQPYGWGGMYEQRDCSSTLRDLFTPFGVWLPRNSGAQAKAGTWIPFEGLSGEQKEKLILEKGLPWRTLIHYPGHIMLYIGARDGRAIILHNFWGLATRDAAGKEGRYVIGRCVITTLQPGIERTDLMPGKGDIRQKIDGMTILKLNAADDSTK